MTPIASGTGAAWSDPRPKNVFVVAPSDIHWHELATVAGAGDRIHFHPLLDEGVVHTERYDIPALLEEARAILDGFEGEVDAVITQWDFPMTMLVPLLCEERGLRSPSLDAVVRCAHKYWSRVAQRESLPDLTPAFELVDPFASDASAIDLPRPFWLKPVKAFGSKLGFRIEDDEQLERALGQIREELPAIAEAFDQLLREAGVSERLQRVGGRYCIAEELLGGVMIAHEGFVLDGEVHFHGTLDMVRDQDSFVRFQWPSGAPDRVHARAQEISRRFLEHIDFGAGCFNVEYFWEPDTDELAMIEVNPRISQSHSMLCVLADGRSNHAIAVDVALGRRPRYTPGAGRYRLAAKVLLRTTEDGRVLRTPTESELTTLERELGGAEIAIDAQEGQRLRELPDQDAYSYLVAFAYIGGDSERELLEKRATLIERLPLEIEGIDLTTDLIGGVSTR
jgi:biotin carboxylase